jgi:hypothetical protein
MYLAARRASLTSGSPRVLDSLRSHTTCGTLSIGGLLCSGITKVNRPVDRIILNQGRERSLLRRHPWVFSGALDHVEGTPQSGETVDVFSGDGRFLGRGAYSPESQIRVRVWTFDQGEEINAVFLACRIEASISLREALQVPAETDVFR